ncbi:hypothetical protein C8F01DRAFT_1275106 [Mycena amicta]|nr:hypothetical protein C8F01DRAFT_1275106 [Mycena amicta]
MAADKTPTSRPLRRGKACFNCRHLKIKCDGKRPMCGPCIRVAKDDPCEYPDTSSRTQELQDTVYRLQSRIDELEGGAGPSHYSIPSNYTTFSAHSSARGSPFSERSAGSHRSFPSEDAPDFDEPPYPMIQLLIQSFLPHATQFGFFLDLQRFHDTALLPLPLGDALRPSPALLCVVYLWGVHLSKVQPLLASEPIFLRRAQHHIATALSSAPPVDNNIIHTIQAQVLLATYLFRIKRLLEAEVHANGAATLALRHGLHRIRSSRPRSPSPTSFSLDLPPPTDAISEGERIRCFWAIAALQSHLCVALNGTSSSAAAAFCVFEGPAADIDTPWPLEIADYASGVLPAGYRGQESIRHLMTDDTFAPGAPVCMLLAKASALMYRAARLAAGWASNLSPRQTTAHLSACAHLDQRITLFWQSLPPVYPVYSDSAAARSLALVHALTAGAALRLHSSPSSPNAASTRDKRLFAARTVLEVLGDVRVLDRATAHPVVGSIAGAACKVLMQELQHVRGAWSLPTSTRTTSGMATPTMHHPSQAQEAAALMVDLSAGVTAMQVYASESALIDHQLQKLRREYDAL